MTDFRNCRWCGGNVFLKDLNVGHELPVCGEFKSYMDRLTGEGILEFQGAVTIDDELPAEPS